MCAKSRDPHDRDAGLLRALATGERVVLRRPVVRRLIERFSTTGLVVGTLFFAASLTPSLIPRTVAFQGVVSGVSLSLGYALGRLARWLWRFLELPIASDRLGRQTTRVVGGVSVVVAAIFLTMATEWQNSVRTLMGMDVVTGVRPLRVALVALLVFATLHLLGWQFHRTARWVTERLKRHVPRRVAAFVGVVAAGALFWTLADGVIFRLVLQAIDGTSRQLDALIESGAEAPSDAWRAQAEQSLIPWEHLGRRGRSFVSSGPTAADISAFGGAAAPEPVRVYVGLTAAETPTERAQLALRELIRVGGFERALLVVVTPTGTGWVDPASVDPLEYLHRGDIATVAAQYSYLPSPVSLLTEAALGAEMARALFQAVYEYWTNAPRDRRPRLYLHGVSLGALYSDLSFDLYDILRDPFDGTLWAGPPFRSPTWNLAAARRDRSSPAWLPRFRDGRVIRFGTQRGGLEIGEAPWGPPRIAFLQYASDPITFFSPRAFFRQPEWLREPRAPDVSPKVRWFPVVTAVQLAADMFAGTDAAPLGYGHNFSPADYIDAWIALTEPAGWSAQDTRRLKALFATYRRPTN